MISKLGSYFPLTFLEIFCELIVFLSGHACDLSNSKASRSPVYGLVFLYQYLGEDSEGGTEDSSIVWFANQARIYLQMVITRYQLTFFSPRPQPMHVRLLRS